MSAFYLMILLEEAVLYGLLAYVAVTASNAEKQAGRDHSSRHLRRAAMLYFLLGVSQLLHG